LKELRRLCDQHKATLIFDEVQCGLGRTGFLWAYQGICRDEGLCVCDQKETSTCETVHPDLLAFAKPIAGGIPMGGVLLSSHIASQIVKGDHGTTFGGGPLACRAAIVTFDRISQPSFLREVREKGQRLVQKLKAINNPKIVEVRGRGLLIGLELDSPVAPLLKYANQHKVLLISAGDNIVRLCPPLTITNEEIDLCINVLTEGLQNKG